MSDGEDLESLRRIRADGINLGSSSLHEANKALSQWQSDSRIRTAVKHTEIALEALKKAAHSDEKIKAAALIVAEIERLDRAKERGSPS